MAAFLVHFSGGTLLFTAAVPRAAVGDRFYRVNAYVALFLAAAAYVTAGVALSPLLGYVAALFAVSGVARWRGFGLWVPAYLLLAAAAVAIGGTGRVTAFAEILTRGVSSAVLGASLVSMLLGHSYLESSNPSFDLLIDACRGLMVVLVIRFAVAIALFLPACSVLSQWIEVDPVLALLAGVRFVAGLACAGILTRMALACAKIRSNQSATGILYVVLGFVMIGELIAAYLGIEKGIRM